MSLKTASEFPQGKHLIFRKITCRSKRGVTNGRRVAYRQDDLVPIGPMRILRIVTEMVEIQYREDIGQVQRAARMSRTRLRQRDQNQFTDMSGNRIQVFHAKLDMIPFITN